MTVGERIQQKMKERKLSQNGLARMAQISQSGLSYIIKGISSPQENTLTAIAAALGCSVSELLGEADTLPAGVIGIIRGAVPLVGEIACGDPITAEQNVEAYIDVPSGIRADFALRCRGSSMEPTFCDGDIVLIRQTPDVADGRIAAVMIDGEATLKRVHHLKSGLMLMADNASAFAPRLFQGEELQAVRILGTATGFLRSI